jgi:hypothetical protein
MIKTIVYLECDDRLGIVLSRVTSVSYLYVLQVERKKKMKIEKTISMPRLSNEQQTTVSISSALFFNDKYSQVDFIRLIQYVHMSNNGQLLTSFERSMLIESNYSQFDY